MVNFSEPVAIWLAKRGGNRSTVPREADAIACILPGRGCCFDPGVWRSCRMCTKVSGLFGRFDHLGLVPDRSSFATRTIVNEQGGAHASRGRVLPDPPLNLSAIPGYMRIR